MSKTYIYIDDQIIDLFPNTTVAFTYQNVLLNQLNKRKVSYTNQFSVPFSNRNAQIFGLANQVTANVNRWKFSGKVVQNGDEIINGVAILTRVKGTFELELFSSFMAFIDAIDNQTIDDLIGIDDTLRTWSKSYIDSIRASNAALVAPALSYGQMVNPDIIQDQSFSGSPSVWTNETWLQGDVAWNIGGGLAIVSLYSWDDGSQTTDGFSKLMLQDFKFVPGQEYTISVTCNYDPQGSTFIRLLAYMVKDQIGNFPYYDGNEGMQLVINRVGAGSSATYTGTVIPDTLFTRVGVAALLPAPAPVATRSGDMIVTNLSITMQLRIGEVYYPSVYLKNIYTTMLNQAGFDYNDSDKFFNSDEFINAIIPFSKDKWEYTGYFKKCREVKAVLSQPQLLNASGNAVFDRITKKDLFGFYNSTTGLYSDGGVPFEPVATIDNRKYYSKFFSILRVEVISGSCTIDILAQGGGTLATQVLAAPGRYSISLAVRLDNNNKNGIECPNNISVYCTLAGGASIRILDGEFFNEVVGYNELAEPKFYACEILPPLKKTDLFKEICMQYGLIPKQVSNKIICKSFNEVIANRYDYLDWTGKRDLKFKEEIIYSSLAYSSNNYFQYKKADELFVVNHSRGNLAITVDSLTGDQVLHESIFAGSYDTSIIANGGSLYVAVVPKHAVDDIPELYPIGDVTINDTGLRILVLRSKLSFEPSMKYNGNVRNDYKIANFLKPNMSILSFIHFVEDNYGLLNSAFNMNMQVSRGYVLNTFDIASIDEHKLVFDTDSFFLLSRVSNAVEGLTTKVEMLKV